MNINFNDVQLKAICDILADTVSGLTNAQITQFLTFVNAHNQNVHQYPNKRTRLFESLRNKMMLDRNSKVVISFILHVMNPINYINNEEEFSWFKSELNNVFAFCGLEIGDDGKFNEIKSVKTINEAEERAGKLKKELINRKVHKDVLKFCNAELLQKNYFHAVLETVKSLADKIRTISDLKSDGHELIDDTLSYSRTKRTYPKIGFNKLETDSEHSEHKGIENLLRGIISAVRNPTSHEPKIYWEVGEDDALDILSLASYLHRKLDKAFKICF